MQAVKLSLITALCMGLSGCTAYYDSINQGNRAMFENPRVAKVKLVGANGQAIQNLASVDIEIPLDAHKLPTVAESPGQQMGHVVDKATPMGLVGLVGGLFKGGSDKTVDKSVTVDKSYIEKVTDTSSSVVEKTAAQ